VDQLPEDLVELAEDHHNVLRFARLGEGGEAVEVAEEHGNLAPVRLQRRIVARGDDEVRELGRKEAPQPCQPLDLADLVLDARFERTVQFRQFQRLLLDAVVVLLHAQERTHPRQQLGPVERLEDEVVGPRFQRGQLLLVARRRDHDDGQRRRPGVRAQLATDFVTIDAGHHDVEQDEVHALPCHDFERFLAGRRYEHAILLRRKHGLEEAHVLGGVIDDEDVFRFHVRPPLGAIRSSPAPIRRSA